MTPWPLRLHPGDDLRLALQALPATAGDAALFVVAGIGSLSHAALRFAGEAQSRRWEVPLEIISLSGSVARNGAHLHAALADAEGRVFGGHVGPGCIVRTTAELLLVRLEGWAFERRFDPATGYAELQLNRGGR
jgi:predicted DNA-binding protein with PD1-like motif